MLSPTISHGCDSSQSLDTASGDGGGPLYESDRHELPLTTVRPTATIPAGPRPSGTGANPYGATTALYPPPPAGGNGNVVSNGNSSVTSPVSGGGRSWQQPKAYVPTPVSSFTVAVSIIPAEQLAPASGPGPGGPLGRSNTYAAFGSSPSFAPMVPPMLSNASFTNSMPFGNTKSFDDVLLLRHSATTTAAVLGGGTGGGGDSMLAGNTSRGGIDEAIQSALAGSDGGTESVPNHLDCYRVHLLLGGGGGGGGEDGSNSLSTGSLVGGSLVDPGVGVGGGEGKRQQVSQVKAKWRQFIQLLQFIDSVAPKFEPPSPPSGYPFPIERGKSYVQNSSFFAGPDAPTHQDSASLFGSPVMSGSLSVGPADHRSGSVAAFPSGGLGHTPSSPETGAKEEMLVTPNRREARRKFMEDYLNAALVAPSVNCLDELQSFVGYRVFLHNERNQFAAAAAAAARQKSSSPLTTTGRKVGARTSTPLPALSSTGAASKASSITVAKDDAKVVKKQHKYSNRRASTSDAAFNDSTSGPPFGISVHSLGSASGASDMSSVLPLAAAVHARRKRHHKLASEDAENEAAGREGDEGGVQTKASSATKDEKARSKSSKREEKRHSHRDHHEGPVKPAASLDRKVRGGNNGSADRDRESSDSRSSSSSSSSGSGSSSGKRGGSVAHSGKDPREGSRTSSHVSSSFSAATSTRAGRGSKHPHPHTSHSPDSSANSEHKPSRKERSATVEYTATAAGRSRGARTHRHRSGGGGRSSSSSSSTPSATSSTGSGDDAGALRPSSSSSSSSASPPNGKSASSSHASSQASRSTSSRHHHHRHHHRRHHHRRHREGDEVKESKGRRKTRSHRHKSRADSGGGEERAPVPSNATTLTPSHAEAAHARDGNGMTPHAAPGDASVAAADAPPLLPPTAGPPPEPPATITEDEKVMLEECFRMVDTAGSGAVAVRQILPFLACALPTSFTELMKAVQPSFHVESSAETRVSDTGTTGSEGTEATTGQHAAGDWATPSFYQTAMGLLPAEVLALPPFAHLEGRIDSAAFLAIVESVLRVLTAATATAAASSTAAAALPASPPAPPPDAEAVSVAAWIDAFWVLQYCRIFTAIAVLQHGDSTAPLRARLTEIKEETYRMQLARHREMHLGPVGGSSAPHATTPPNPLLSGMATTTTTTDATAPLMSASPLSTSSQTRTGAHFLDETSVLPVVLPAVAEALLSPENPTINGFDVFELFCFFYIIGEGGIRVVSVEEVLSWVGLRSYARDLSFSLEELASLLDCVSKAIPFSELLRSLHAPQRSGGGSGNLLPHHHQPTAMSLTQRNLDAHAAHDPPHNLPKATSYDSILRFAGQDAAQGRPFPQAAAATTTATTWRQRMMGHVRVLRLVSRGALVADPLVLAAVQDKVIEHSWRVRGGVCVFCDMTKDALRGQQSAVNQLVAEQQRLNTQLTEAESALAEERRAVKALSSELEAARSQLQTVMQFLDGGDGSGGGGGASGPALVDVGRRTPEVNDNGTDAAHSVGVGKRDDCAVVVGQGNDLGMGVSALASDTGLATQNGSGVLVRQLTPYRDSAVAVLPQVTMTGSITYSIRKDVPLANAEYPAVFYLDLYPCRSPADPAAPGDPRRALDDPLPLSLLRDGGDGGGGSRGSVKRRERIALRDGQGRCLLLVLLDASTGTLTVTGASATTGQTVSTRNSRGSQHPHHGDTVVDSGNREHSRPKRSLVLDNDNHRQHPLDSSRNSSAPLLSSLAMRHDSDGNATRSSIAVDLPRDVNYSLRRRNLLFPSYPTTTSQQQQQQHQQQQQQQWEDQEQERRDRATGEAQQTDPTYGRCTRTVALAPYQWHRLRVALDWSEGSFQVTLCSLLGSVRAAQHGPASPMRVLAGPAVLDFTAYWLDGAREVEGLATVDLYPRTSLLYAYCNACVMFDPTP